MDSKRQTKHNGTSSKRPQPKQGTGDKRQDRHNEEASPQFAAYKKEAGRPDGQSGYVFPDATDKANSGNTILGAYVNIAEDNLARAMQHILMKIGLKASGDYAEILSNIREAYIEERQRITGNTDERIKHKEYLLTSEQNVKFMALLFHHFPVLAPIVANVKNKAVKKEVGNGTKNESLSDEEKLKEYKQAVKSENIADCLSALVTLVKALHYCRNMHSHYNPYNSTKRQKEEIYSTWSKAAIYLEYALKASALICEAKSGTNKTQYEFYTGKYHYSTDKQGNVTTQEYQSYYYRIRGKRFVVKANGKPYEEEGEVKAISDFGLIYLVSIFLRKSDMELMLDNLRLFEKSPFKRYFPDIFDKESTALKSMMSVYRINIPKGDRLKMEDNNVQLCMDMLNELQKCPAELYPLLPKEGKDFFRREQMRPVIDAEMGEYVRERFVKSENGQQGQQKITSTDGTGNIKYEPTGVYSLLLRKEDRFPYFALRYIDSQKLFSTIRFQIDLGYYRFAFYDKKKIDGKESMRILQKHINGFGRLVETEQKRISPIEEGGWAGMFQEFHIVPPRSDDDEGNNESKKVELEQLNKSTADTKPFVTDKRASYNIHNNRIGLSWEVGSTESYVPKLEVKNPNERQKTRANVDIKSPMASLSVRDLPALIFYEYLRENHKGIGVSAEEIIKLTYALYVKFFKGVNAGSIKTWDDVKDMGVTQEDIKDMPELKWQNPQLSAVATNMRLEKKDIPSKLIEYLCKDNRPSSLSQEARVVGLYEGKEIRNGKETYHYPGHIQERIDYLEREIKRFNDICRKMATTDNEYGTDDYRAFRPASLARKLAKSIMEWMPADSPAKKMMTGANYGILVAVLTVLGSDGHGLDYLMGVLQEGGILPKPNEELNEELYHPFLNAVLTSDIKKIEDLYINYIIKEKEHLISIKDKLLNKSDSEKFDIIGHCMPFSRLSRSRFQERDDAYYKKLASSYLKIDNTSNGGGENDHACILLPDGLFTKYILDILKKLEKELGMSLDENACKRNNTSYLISTYFNQVMCDDSQAFFHSNDEMFRRTYEFFNYYLDSETKSLSPKDVAQYLKKSDKEEMRQKAEQYIDLENRKIKNDKSKAERELKDTKRRKEDEWEVYSRWERKKITVNKQDKIDRLTKKIASLDDRIVKAKERKQKYMEKLSRLRAKCEKTEKAIRRCRIEDIVSFLMVRTLFKRIYDKDKEKLKLLKLQAIGSNASAKENNGGETFLDSTVPFSRNVPVKFEVNKEGTLCDGEEKGTKVNMTCEIFLNEIAIRHYNLTLTYLKIDDRLTTFLRHYAYMWYKKTSQKSFRINYNRLMLEFERYNQLRPQIFGEVQAIERLIVTNCKDILNNEKHRDFFVKKDKYETMPDGTRIDADARRNSFVNLLVLAYDSTTEDSSLMKLVRNAACHNTYSLPFDKLQQEDFLFKLLQVYQQEDVASDVKDTLLAKREPKSFAQLIYNKIHEIRERAEKEIPTLIAGMKAKKQVSPQSNPA